MPTTYEEFKSFWTGVIGVVAEYDLDDESIIEWVGSLQNKDQTPFPLFNGEAWDWVVKRCKNWKAPGPDNLQGYWLKAFPEMTQVLGQRLLKSIKHPKRLEHWLIEGRMVLIPKEGCEGKPHQYRPMTCLNLGCDGHTLPLCNGGWGHPPRAASPG